MRCDRILITQQHLSFAVWVRVEKPETRKFARPFAAQEHASTVVLATRCDDDRPALAAPLPIVSLRPGSSQCGILPSVSRAGRVVCADKLSL
jgi:hypothetical protein